MSKSLEINQVRDIMKNHFIGPDELKNNNCIDFDIKETVNSVPFSRDELRGKRDNYILIYGANRFREGKVVTIRSLIEVFGKDPEIKEPCFYNQDWYDKESFIDKEMEEGWFLIRKNIYDDSRAVQPNDLEKKYEFPSAIRCCYSFFVSWLCLDVKLWYHDFVWCCDVDHNGDRIYVGKYNDVDGVNKNGFNIHRHLALRQCYGCID